VFFDLRSNDGRDARPTRWSVIHGCAATTGQRLMPPQTTDAMALASQQNHLTETYQIPIILMPRGHRVAGELFDILMRAAEF